VLAVMACSATRTQTAGAGDGAAGRSGGSLLNKTIPYAVPAGLAAWTVLLGHMFIASGQA
jgi:hypothetical protein